MNKISILPLNVNNMPPIFKQSFKLCQNTCSFCLLPYGPLIKQIATRQYHELQRQHQKQEALYA